jgi:hypothetical protein
MLGCLQLAMAENPFSASDIPRETDKVQQAEPVLAHPSGNAIGQPQCGMVYGPE